MSGLCGEYQSKRDSNLLLRVKWDAGIFLTVQNFIDTHEGRAWLNKEYNISPSDLFANYSPRQDFLHPVSFRVKP